MRKSEFELMRVMAVETDDCIEWGLGKSQSGYGKIKIDGLHKRAHRVVYERKYGSIDSEVVVMHSCDNRACCNYRHLIAGTHKENMADMASKLRARRGSGHGMSKLNEQQVAEVIALYATGDYTQKAIAKKYGVHKTLIRLIVNRMIWKHVPITLDDKEAIRKTLNKNKGGENCWLAEMTKEKAIAILKSHKDGGRTQRQTAEIFGVNQATVSRLVSGKHWISPEI